jgi:uncharacterized ferredoxin-like protein
MDIRGDEAMNCEICGFDHDKDLDEQIKEMQEMTDE